MVEREPHGAGSFGGRLLSTTSKDRRVQRNGPSRGDVYVVTGALVFLSAVAWFLIGLATDASMTVGVLTRPRSGGAMPMGDHSASMSLTLFIATWLVMMIAMMFPAIAPVVLLFDRWRRNRRKNATSTLSFVGGYLTVWTFAGLVAFGALALIETHVQNSTAAVRVGGVTLVAAGAYQLSPLKTICLTKCRSPLGLVMEHAQRLGRGLQGPFQVGILHGAYCLGCCWALMAILLVLGLMNLGWMAAVSGLILVEKILPGGRELGRVIGVAISLVGATIVITGSGLGN